MQPSKKAAARSARSQAIKTLLSVTQNQASLSTLLNEFESDLVEQERPLYRELTLGLCRWYFQLDRIANSLLSRPLRQKDQATRLLILLGLYQLLYTRIPEHAALNETVALADTFQAGSQKGLVNGVLRNFQRTREAVLAELASDLVFRFSHPAWMIQKIYANWPDMAEHILNANNNKAPITLRINRMKISREAYQSQLDEQGIAHEACLYSPVGIRLTLPVPVMSLPGFEKGWFSVQDEAAQLCTDLLDLTCAPLRILDACAAPGGKTTAILEATNNQAQVTALEFDPSRLERVRDNLARLELNARLITGDATDLSWWDKEPFDRILVDAPCSASGVIRKHPDIKLLRRETDISALADTQLAILSALWPTLAPGGTLVYATCSVFTQENTRIIERFLARTPNACSGPLSADWGLSSTYGRQLFPTQNSHDGFYYAQIRKMKNSQ